MAYQCHNFCNGEILSADQLNEIEQGLVALEELLADHLYDPITITAFTAKDTATGKNTLEIGSTVTNVAFAWSFSKTPQTITLNGETIPVDSTGTTLDVNVSGDTSWSLVATDERGATSTKDTSVSFVNGVYYGALDYGTDIDSAVILGLTRKLQSGRSVSFTAGGGKRPTYALPTRYGTPTFKIGGFDYEWEKVKTFDFTNASGYTESYDVWMHSQNVTDSVTVNVT